jgi:hypothetical protein
VGSKARDDVGVFCCGREGRDVKHARVSGVRALAIWEAGNNGLVGWAHVGHGGSSCEKVTCPARIKDGKCFCSGHVELSRLTVLSSAAVANAYYGVGVGQRRDDLGLKLIEALLLRRISCMAAYAAQKMETALVREAADELSSAVFMR